MHLNDYQQLARETDQFRGHPDDPKAMMVALLGLAGEVGELLSEYKKHLRDGDAYKLFGSRAEEELGDLLWYLSNVASRLDLDLESVAAANIAKCRQRWIGIAPGACRFDNGFPEKERLPDQFKVEMQAMSGSARRVRIMIQGEQIGDELTDNAQEPDSYRFHDVLHYAFASVLGWSPVLRRLLKRKRKSDPSVDEVEDGGRAAAIEEGIIAYIFPMAKAHSFYASASRVDSRMLRTLQMMTEHLEVGGRTTAEWESAILQGFEVWRALIANEGGVVLVDLNARRIAYVENA